MSQSSSSQRNSTSRVTTDDVVKKAVRYALAGGTMMAAIGALHAQDKPAKSAKAPTGAEKAPARPK